MLPDLDGYLVGEDGARHPLVDPPPGTYGVWVFFDNQKASLATQVTVAPGQTVRLRCDALSGVCR
ncbi:MAG: hypothetical protein H6736_21640 [Alphaproteobacteria bacterium]|nr:hypothetical protein [Alphaproteobacteria bacterium]